MLAFEDEQLVGYAYLTHEPALRRGVLDLVAGGEHWGGGVGDALLGETMARARSAGLSVVHVDVQEADEERRRTYSERWMASCANAPASDARIRCSRQRSGP